MKLIEITILDSLNIPKFFSVVIDIHLKLIESKLKKWYFFLTKNGIFEIVKNASY